MGNSLQPGWWCNSSRGHFHSAAIRERPLQAQTGIHDSGAVFLPKEEYAADAIYSQPNRKVLGLIWKPINGHITSMQCSKACSVAQLKEKVSRLSSPTDTNDMKTQAKMQMKPMIKQACFLLQKQIQTGNIYKHL